MSRLVTCSPTSGATGSIPAVASPLFEKALVQTSALSGEDSLLILHSPAAVSILLLAVVLVAGPPVTRRLRRARTVPEAAEAPAPKTPEKTP
ncbi:hypothetical protein [Streptomyces sp. NPDC051684]|uniref:hypothetical protein n=1 Tax=Streptomyces sp. NPDC051684 TaxID=3365670 RepID=UPI0037BBF734